MKFEHELTIAAPREYVLSLFADPDNLAKWQPGFVGYTQITGEPRALGAMSKHIHLMDGRTTETLETILESGPEHWSALYDSDGMWNLIDNEFAAMDDATCWTMRADCRGSSVVQQLMVRFFKRSIMSHSYANMTAFKDYVEREHKDAALLHADG